MKNQPPVKGTKNFSITPNAANMRSGINQSIYKSMMQA